MIVYEAGFSTVDLLGRVYGAPWTRSVWRALPSTFIAVYLHLLISCCKPYLFEGADESLSKSGLMTNSATFTVFTSVIAFSLGFRLNLSYQRYWESCTTLMRMRVKWFDAALDVLSQEQDTSDEAARTAALKFRTSFMHCISLMHAVAMQTLRGDSDLTNLEPGSFRDIPEPPPADPGENAFWLSILTARGAFFLKTTEEHLTDYYKANPITVLGGVTPAEAERLERCSDRVLLVRCWTNALVAARQKSGGMTTEAKGYGSAMTVGCFAYENALKVIDTPFPFPYAQSVTLLLHINAILCPLMMARWTAPTWLVGILTFFIVFAFYLLNDTARELENPFKRDPNNLPVSLYQHTLNRHLVTLFTKSELPGDSNEDGDFLPSMKVGSISRSHVVKLLQVDVEQLEIDIRDEEGGVAPAGGSHRSSGDQIKMEDDKLEEEGVVAQQGGSSRSIGKLERSLERDATKVSRLLQDSSES